MPAASRIRRGSLPGGRPVLTTRILSTHPVIAVLLVACVGDGDHKSRLALRSEAVIYGQDDRVDVGQAPEPFAGLALHSIPAVIHPDRLKLRADGDYDIDGPSLGEVFGLCAGERFAAQPSVASCSAVLVAPDLVVASGHCFGFGSTPHVDCSQQRYVFGYARTQSDAPITIKAENVYQCSDVIARVVSRPTARCQWDFGVVRLDRQTQMPLVPVSIRSNPVKAGEKLAVVGYTAGLPVKIDLGSHVLDPRHDQGDFFTLDSDTFSVSSGSGVFDASGQLVGIFARGSRDFDDAGTCQRVHHEDAASSEVRESATQIVPVIAAMDALARGETPVPCDVAEGPCVLSACSVGTDAGFSAGSGGAGPRVAIRAIPSRARAASCSVDESVRHAGAPFWMSWWLVLCAVTRRRWRVSRSARN